MDELEQEFPLAHPEYSPVLSFLYQNLPFLSILIGTAGNAYAISRLQNSIQLPIRLEKVLNNKADIFLWAPSRLCTPAVQV